MKTEKFDIAKLIEDLTESEKLCLYGFIIGLKEKRGNPEQIVQTEDD